MSKHNNSLRPSSAAKCRCRRKMTIGEEKGGVNPIGYECPDCSFRPYRKPMTSKEYYSSLGITNCD